MNVRPRSAETIRVFSDGMRNADGLFCRLSPYLLGRSNDHAKLVHLVFDADTIAHDRGRKPTLGTERQTLLWNVSARLLDPRDQLLLRFPTWPLRRDQSQYGHLIFGYLRQRFERTRALVVVLQQQSLCPDTLEYGFCEPSIVPFGQPPAALVATSKVKTKGHLWETAHHGVVHLNAATQPLIESPALLLVEEPSLGIEQQRIMRCIDLDVSSA